MQSQCPECGGGLGKGGAARILTVFLWGALLICPGILCLLIESPRFDPDRDFEQFPVGVILSLLLALGLSILLAGRLRPRTERLGLGVVLFMTSIFANMMALPGLLLLLTILSESFGSAST